MSLNIRKILEEGVAAHNYGDSKKQKDISLYIKGPSHADVNYNLGLIEYSEFCEGSHFFRNALDERKDKSFWLSYIKALINNNIWQMPRARLKNRRKGFLIDKSYLLTFVLSGNCLTNRRAF